MIEVKPTQKPVPSSDIKDLFFNSGLLDIWATSLERKYIDRFGNCHLTASGMEWLFKELVEKFKVDMNIAIVAAGYIAIDSFQQGADLPNNEITLRNHILRDETTGEYYRWDGDLPKQVPAGSTPQSTGGIDKGAWISVGDASLRSEMLNSQGGSISIHGLLVRYTPIAYGAKADGTTDDTEAFNECILAAPDGSTIDLQGGTYLAECMITKNNIHITNGTIKAPYNATKGCIVADGVSNVTVSHVRTIVDKENKHLYSSKNVSGVHFENCNNVTVSHVHANGSKNDVYESEGSWGCTIHAYMCSGVNISFCKSSNSDKEGIMTRMSNDVWINNCESDSAGYSCIGTSGGDRAMITDCYATASNATAITMNSRVSSVVNCIVENGGGYAGINIGHDNEPEQYGLDCIVTGNIVRDCIGNGISVSKGQHIVINSNVITGVTGDGVHVHSMTGNASNLLSVIISNNTITAPGRSGVWCYESNHLLNTAYTIACNNIDGSGLYGIRVNANRSISLLNNTLRNITDVAFFIRPSDGSASNTSNNIAIDGNNLISCTASAITSTPAKSMSIRNNNLYGFNSSASTFSTAIVITGSVAGVNYELPNELKISGNIIEGTIGSGTSIINISTDNITGTKRQLSITDNLIRNSENLVIYPASRYVTPRVTGNTIGLDESFISVTVNGSSNLVVKNSNQTPINMPVIVARNNAGRGVYISSLVNGSITLTNSNSENGNVTLQW
ncbi:TPA: right-handed parallel beta-helix repeat-containing protein [Providencia alcalifaciens]